MRVVIETSRVAFLLPLFAALACGSSGSGGGPDTGDGSDPTGGSGGRGGSSGSVICEPGSTQACVGPGACRGGQSCLPDGSGWGVCNCEGAGGASGAGGSGFPTGGTITGGTSSGNGGSAGSGFGGTTAVGGSSSGGSTSSGGAPMESDRGEVHWRLNGTEVASGQLDASHTGTNMSFASRTVTAYIVTLRTGTFECADLPANGTSFTMGTADTTGMTFPNLPARWKGLFFRECNAYQIPDVTTTTLRVTRWDTRAVGTFDMTITGAGERAGDTMVLSGSFDVRVVLQQ